MGPGTVASTETENQPSDTPPSGKLLWVIAVVPVIVAAVVIAGIFLWKKKKRAEHSMGPDTPACTAPDDPSKTIYVQVGSFPAGQSDAKKPQPKKRTKTDDGIHTVYASVVQPKPVKTPLQTDDEKIQSESQRASNKSKKTIYSTVAAPQETDDHNIKTLYDTVSAPTGPKGSEFQKLL